MSQQFPEYIEIQNAIDKIEQARYPSEIHGCLCGLLCTDRNLSAQGWFEKTFQQLEPGNLLQQEGLEQLSALFQTTVQQMNDPDFDFHLLLPDDNADISSRVQSLSDWCQGFLLGLSMGGMKELQKLPEDAIEIATDIAKIAQAGSSYELSDTDEDEESYQELIEYIRVGVLLINEELQPVIAQPQVDPTIH